MSGTAVSKEPVPRRRLSINQLILTIVLFAGSFIMIIPFLWMLITSFDWAARLNITFPPKIWPEEPSIRTFEVAFTNIKMFLYIGNSTLVSAGVILISSLSALLSGYALSKLRFKGANIVLLLALSTMMIPFEMTMIPQYLLFSELGLVDNYLAFYLPAMNYAFGTFLAKAFFDQLPSSLREAAVLDGAKEFTVFSRVYLPLCTPIIATMVILLFLGVWNDMLWPLLILKSASKYTIQIGLAMFTYNNGINQQPSIIMAATTASLIPVIAVYLFLQRYIIESIALSGIKQ
ncbi:carbohydrate ABC transporter permease [Paenibacillus lactis]|uniref:Multiple sugar transport system permease protein n=1 Tax=Paenibacillus lactis TaxID=228574 RepID=A0ABS4FI51_9BACL|nr:carbohydrate ABC transporter permease [Paenibacillus lactis]MBP1895915.1 multiple sugar transport system permease protein [Paenibacillus lactis]